ncbi:hypothetical protein ACLMJK_008285 [Lecanora helva]
MPPIHNNPGSSAPQPRVVLYHQTHYRNSTEFVSALPLITEAASTIPITHLIIAAFHINEDPNHITLNNDPPADPRHDRVWEEVKTLQDAGVTVLGMLGGAAKGSYRRLDRSEEEFATYYTPLRDVIRQHNLQGLDLDVEETMSIEGIIRLIDCLKLDFGPSFIITLAPVARALQGLPHLSGFDYQLLEAMRGDSIAWYNTQFYNNWGSLGTFADYDIILAAGWKLEKVVVGFLTHPGLGRGYVEWEELKRTVMVLAQFYRGFGGMMGWEYFCSMPGGEERPWEWAVEMGRCVGRN